MRKKPIDEESAKLKMAGLCARAEQCSFDISQKLFRMGLSSEARNRIIEFLEEKEFLDDYRFARSYARDKCRFSGWGPYKIRQGLSVKRVGSEAIAEALESVEDKDWEEALARAAATKVKNLDLIGEEAKQNRVKLMKFLLGRGFEYDDAFNEVKKAVKHQKEVRQP